MLQGYADEHVSDAIVGALRARGMDVVSVAQLGRQGTDDAILLDHALTDKRVLLPMSVGYPGSRLPPSFSGHSNNVRSSMLLAK